MKKFMYLAALAAATLSSCSNDENNAQVEESNLTPVVLGATYKTASVETRGTGTVGDMEGGDNVFQFEDLYVLMTNIPASNATEWKSWGFTSAGGTGATSSLGLQFDNTFFCRPEASTDNVSSINYMGNWGTNGGTKGVQKYYPTGGSSDFFAYYIDNAAKNNTDGNPTLTIDNDAETMSLDFVMDGSQDILAGKAADPSTTERGFSAKTARNNVIPVINMKHVLTRLTFEVVSGHDNAEGVQVNSVAVESQNQGSLLVAYNAAGDKEAEDLVTWADEEPVKFYLKEKPAAWTPSIEAGKPSLQTLTPAVMGKKDAEDGDQTIGEALFVKPGETKYKLTMNLTQHAKVDGGVNDEPMEISRDITLDGAEFKAGYSYHVKVIVYGLSEIEIKASLEAWKDGGTITIDTAN